MKEYDKYQDFTLSLAIVDAFPVIIFGIMVARIGMVYQSFLFSCGALLMLIGGTCKVLWKILLGTIHRDVRFLDRPLFIVLLPSGFWICVISVIVNISRISWGNVVNHIVSFPTLLFLVLGMVGLIVMVVFTKRHDHSLASNNWIEECTNIFAQIMMLFGVFSATM